MGVSERLRPGTAVTTWVTNPASWVLTPTPPVIAGLTLWYKADSITGKSTGDSIAQWNDSSGNGSHGTATFQPTYIASATRNGRPAVRFNDVGNGTVMTIPNVLTGLTAGTLLVVIKAHTNSFGGMAWLGTPDDAFYPWNDTNIYDNFGTTVRKDAIAPVVSLLQWNIVSVVSAANDYRYYINTVNRRTTATNTVGWTTTPVWGRAGAFYLRADVAEIMVYSGALSDANRNAVEAYLKAKWATV